MVSETNKKLKPLTLALILPAYNEEEVIPYTIPLFLKEIENLINEKIISPTSFVCIVNDGSVDNTQKLIEILIKQYPNKIKSVKLDENKWQNSALIKWLECVYNKSDLAITLDIDGQDPPWLIKQMIEEYKKWFEIVYGVRKYDRTVPFTKRFFSDAFYKIVQLLNTSIIPWHAEARLMSQKAIQIFLSEKNYHSLFLRTYFPSLKLPSKNIAYTKKARKLGKSKYDFLQLIRIGIKIISNKKIN